MFMMPRRLCLYIFLCVVIIFLSLQSTCARLFGDAERGIETFIQESLKCRHVPGMAISVVKGK